MTVVPKRRYGPQGRFPLRVEPRVLLLLLAVLAIGWGFVALAGEVAEGETAAFDTTILLALRNASDPSDPIGPPWLEEMVRDMTALGGFGVLTLVTLGVAGFLWLRGNRGSTCLLLASIAGGRILSALLKTQFGRLRPDLVPHGSIVISSSFPSGHSTMAAITYFTLAIMAARSQDRRVTKVYLIALAAVFALAVGASRVYLGVHWPTDVAAGWAVGIIWAIGTDALAETWRRRRDDGA